jgi:hypothetical protein
MGVGVVVMFRHVIPAGAGPHGSVFARPVLASRQIIWHGCAPAGRAPERSVPTTRASHGWVLTWSFQPAGAGMGVGPLGAPFPPATASCCAR